MNTCCIVCNYRLNGGIGGRARKVTIKKRLGTGDLYQRASWMRSVPWDLCAFGVFRLESGKVKVSKVAVADLSVCGATSPEEEGPCCPNIISGKGPPLLQGSQVGSQEPWLQVLHLSNYRVSDNLESKVHLSSTKKRE